MNIGGFNTEKNEVRGFGLESEIRAINESSGTLEAMVSNKEIDRYRSIILPGGIDKHIRNYKANPIFAWQHDVNRILGRAQDVWRTSTEVWARLEFDLKDRFASNIFRLYKDKFVRAFSPRTRSHLAYFSWEAPRDLEPLKDIDEEAYDHLMAGRADYVIAEHEYLEISGCTIPGNATCLLRALDAGCIEREFAFEAMGRIVPSSHAVNFERKENTDEMTPEQQQAIIDGVAKQLAERMAEQAPKGEVLSIEPALTEDNVRTIAKEVALELLSELLPDPE